MSKRPFPQLDQLRSGVRFGKFVSVGAIGAAFDVTTLVILTQFVGVEPAIANVISIETAILVMFAVNEHWTFAGEGAPDRRSVGGRLVRSHVVRAVGSTLQYVLFVLVFYGVTVAISFHGIDLWLVLVKGGSIGVAMIVNYVFESLFTWRVHRDPAGEN